MTEYMHLVGAEDVQRAANTMRAAGEQMAQASATIDHSLEMFTRRFEELIVRMEVAAAVMAKHDERSMFETVFGKSHG